jgi:hypothetical protein
MTTLDPNDPARVPNGYSIRPASDTPDPGGISVWGFPLIVIAALVILGFVFFGTHERSMSASNTAARSGQTMPAPAPAAPAAPKK